MVSSRDGNCRSRESRRRVDPRNTHGHRPIIPQTIGGEAYRIRRLARAFSRSGRSFGLNRFRVRRRVENPTWILNANALDLSVCSTRIIGAQFHSFPEAPKAGTATER